MKHREEHAALEAELDAKFKAWLRSFPDNLEDYTTKKNAREYDFVFRRFHNRCQAPGCGYPLPYLNNYTLPFIGDVCNLCHVMYMAVASRNYFVDIQRQWKEQQNRRP